MTVSVIQFVFYAAIPLTLLLENPTSKFFLDRWGIDNDFEANSKNTDPSRFAARGLAILLGEVFCRKPLYAQVQTRQAPGQAPSEQPTIFSVFSDRENVLSMISQPFVFSPFGSNNQTGGSCRFTISSRKFLFRQKAIHDPKDTTFFDHDPEDSEVFKIGEASQQGTYAHKKFKLQRVTDRLLALACIANGPWMRKLVLKSDLNGESLFIADSMHVKRLDLPPESLDMGDDKLNGFRDLFLGVNDETSRPNPDELIDTMFLELGNVLPNTIEPAHDNLRIGLGTKIESTILSNSVEHWQLRTGESSHSQFHRDSFHKGEKAD